MSARGFGLLEVLISGAMLIAGITGIVSAQASINASLARERRLTIAAHVAEQTIERLLVLFPGDAQLGGGSHTGPSFDDQGTVAATGRYSARWTVTLGDPIAGARRVVVEVQWLDGGTTRTYALTTIRT